MYYYMYISMYIINKVWLVQFLTDQQWMSKCDRFTRNSADPYLINTSYSTVSSDNKAIWPLSSSPCM